MVGCGWREQRGWSVAGGNPKRKRTGAVQRRERWNSHWERGRERERRRRRREAEAFDWADREETTGKAVAAARRVRVRVLPLIEESARGRPGPRGGARSEALRRNWKGREGKQEGHQRLSTMWERQSPDVQRQRRHRVRSETESEMASERVRRRTE